MSFLGCITQVGLILVSFPSPKVAKRKHSQLSRVAVAGIFTLMFMLSFVDVKMDKDRQGTGRMQFIVVPHKEPTEVWL
jgi:hypothetical protein